MWIGMYKDTASHYGLCKDDGYSENKIELNVPEDMLRGYFDSWNEDDDTTFERWIREEYTYDDMDGLLEYVVGVSGGLECIEKGE